MELMVALGRREEDEKTKKEKVANEEKTKKDVIRELNKVKKTMRDKEKEILKLRTEITAFKKLDSNANNAKLDNPNTNTNGNGNSNKEQ
jgi:glycerol-3-phosphate cytidylyltransferase-like family protein